MTVVSCTTDSQRARVIAIYPKEGNSNELQITQCEHATTIIIFPGSLDPNASEFMMLGVEFQNMNPSLISPL